MATGFLSNGVCFETSKDAEDNYYSSIASVSSFDAAGTYHQSYHFYSDKVMGVQQADFVWQRCQRDKDLTGYTTIFCQVVGRQYPSCVSPTESFNLGVEFAWYFLGVLIAAWGIHFCARFFK